MQVRISPGLVAFSQREQRCFNFAGDRYYECFRSGRSMKVSDIYHKTTKGQSEIESRAHGLSMQQRRVLILVNGSNNIDELQRLSRCENVAEILETLSTGAFIDSDSEPTTTVEAKDYSASKSARASNDIKASKFMCNTLLTFANRARVGKLIEQIQSSKDNDSLKELIKPWYQAISETPGGRFRADDLRAEVRKMIDIA